MTIKGARRILADYLALMDLTEWTVFLRWASSRELGQKDGQDEGWCRWSPEYAHVEMILRRSQEDGEIEHTIVHELVHVALQGHRPHVGKYDEMYERGINRIATAIIRSTKG